MEPDDPTCLCQCQMTLDLILCELKKSNKFGDMLTKTETAEFFGVGESTFSKNYLSEPTFPMPYGLKNGNDKWMKSELTEWRLTTRRAKPKGRPRLVKS